MFISIHNFIIIHLVLIMNLVCSLCLFSLCSSPCTRHAQVVLVRLGLLRVHCGERRLLCALGRPVYSEPVLVRHVPVVERAIGVHSVPARHCLVAARLAVMPGVFERLLWKCDRPRRVLQLPGGLDRHAAVALGGRDRVHVVRRRLVH